MIPEVKGIFLIDFSSSECFVPDDPSDFGVALRVMIGPQYQDAADSLRFTVCSPAWHARECAVDGFVWRWDILIVNEYSRVEIGKIIERVVSRSAAPTWLQIAEQMSRRSNWEFDTYT
ncbi:hypothetical protein HNQ07_003815 [Deinococcus metalli]|uniref:Uncharacterized protein n=1 Tax=Deinococcus metalli TaxID=1141878 RepID=A0A7W8KHH5_9DEIO|nr:Imm8 family immunity protein [Deinococcus metalli]MBB5378309.1 hypothetical protein [Deinococcus metalli]GHF59821.1 hypothetical protein GCM10017781_40220 [Deinococcus metalli]